ncbi:hypothetical protein BSKO_12620 [Bryopsis sp. KO-2023]|nr:hypothetical protein BSKO_12620 [Bryopsis sp. KO-2023]
MQAFPRRVLGFVAIAISVNSVFACSDIKMFLAPCTVKQFGTSISKEQALTLQSQFLRRQVFEAIADQAIGYFDFGLEAFGGTFEFSLTQACDAIEGCGCDDSKRGTFAAAVPINDGGRLRCYTRDDGSLHCKVDRYQKFGPIGGTIASVADQCTGETILSFCFGNQCKGLLLPNGFVKINSEPNNTPPRCADEILTSCCNTQNLSCRCTSCSSRFWRRTKPSADFFDVRNRDNVCIC